jgi:transketolase
MNPDMIHSLNSLRILSVDMIREAGAGHPGIALGAAPIIYSLYANHLRVYPTDPNWVNRDRFVLSAGHGSALLYATLFMAGFDISIDDLVNFRRLDSKTPGHPELGKTPGVEVTTGPLGQGVANAVGMAIAEKYLRALASDAQPKQKLIDYYVYCLASDGDLMEGVATEAASIAGNLALDHLIILYDSNEITLDGAISLSSHDELMRKYISMGFEVDFVQEGNDVREIDKAIERAKFSKKPTLIEIRTTIGRGSFNEGKNTVHGKPLTNDDIANLRKKYKIETGPMEITENAVKYLRYSIANRVNNEYKEWHNYYNSLKTGPNESIKKFINFLETKKMNTEINTANFRIQNDYNEELRESNSKMINYLSERTKYFIGGSADVGTSAHTIMYKEIEMSRKYPAGRNIYFGVREHAMGAIMNGIALSGLRVYGSCFLPFADYLLPAMRL